MSPCLCGDPACPRCFPGRDVAYGDEMRRHYCEWCDGLVRREACPGSGEESQLAHDHVIGPRWAGETP